VRGPQSALFGRNTLGGLVNVVTERPSLSAWTGGVTVPVGNFGSYDVTGTADGPLGDRVAVGFSVGGSERQGFTTNAITGNDLDRRSSTCAKAQVLFAPTSAPTRSWRRAISRGAPIATSSRRPRWCGM
jgi:iron complex outermembrane recepter protein